MKSFLYTQESFESKKESHENIQRCHWMKHINTVKTDDLWFYLKGHTIAYDLKDYENDKVDEIIVDIDDATEELVDTLIGIDPFTQWELCDNLKENGFEIDCFIFLPSASKAKNKCKGFFYLKHDVDTDGIKKFYKTLENFFNTPIDYHNGQLTQVTFGSKMKEKSIYTHIRYKVMPQIDATEDEYRINDTPAVQPKKTAKTTHNAKASPKASASTSKHNTGKPNTVKPNAGKSNATAYTIKPIQDIELINKIPLNSYQKRLAIGRNVIFNEPRFDWGTEKFRKYTECGISKTAVDPILIRKGHRHMSAFPLTVRIAGQALVMQKWHNWNFTKQDIVDNVVLTIAKSFEDGYKFIYEQDEFKHICDIVDCFYDKYNKMCADDFNAEYDKICKDVLQIKPKRVYIPRCLSIRNTFLRFHDELENLDYESAKQLCFKITKGNDKRAKALLRLYSKEFGKPMKISRCQVYLNSCKIVNGVFIVDRKHMQNSHFTKYCKSNNISISSSINNTCKSNNQSIISQNCNSSNSSNNNYNNIILATTCIIPRNVNIADCGIPLWENDYPTESGIDGFGDESPLESEELDE